jgi:hypothetical protein
VMQQVLCHPLLPGRPPPHLASRLPTAATPQLWRGWGSSSTVCASWCLITRPSACSARGQQGCTL